MISKRKLFYVCRNENVFLFIHFIQKVYLVSFNANFSFILRCDKAIVLEDGVLLGDTLCDFLRGLYTKFLENYYLSVKYSNMKKINILPPIASYVCNVDVL